MKKILVLTSERHIARLIQVNLDRQGYDVVAACSPTDVLVSIAADRPDAILTDISMRFLDGTDVFRILKRHPSTRGIPIYVVPTPGSSWLQQWTEFRDDPDDDDTLQ